MTELRVSKERLRAPRTAPVNRSGVGFALAAAVVSGFSVWLNGQVVTRVDVFGDPGTYTTAKNLVAGAVVLLLALAGTLAGGSLGLVRPKRRSQWVGLAAVAVVGGAIPFLLFFEGLAASGSPADAQLVHKAGLLAFVAILGPAVLRERLGGLTLLGVGVVLVGYWIISPELGSVGLSTGLFLVLAASLCWASEAIVDRWLLADLSPSTLAVARLGAGSLVLLAIGLVNGDSARITDMGTAAWGWVLLTGLVLAGYAMLWLYALANAQAVDVTAVLTIAVVVTAGIRLAVDGTPIPSPLGVGVIAVGGVLAAVAASRRASSTVQWSA